jgi:hypothetical protein
MKYNEKSCDAVQLGKLLNKSKLSSVVHKRAQLDYSRDQSLARGLGINLMFHKDDEIISSKKDEFVPKGLATLE